MGHCTLGEKKRSPGTFSCKSYSYANSAETSPGVIWNRVAPLHRT